MAVLNPVDKFYRSVMEEVLLECREMFLDDGVDEIVLTELKQMWEKKVKQSKVFEFTNLHGSSSSFGMGSYGIISSSRNTTCPEILVPSIHLAGPRGNGLNNNYTPTATIALPYGLYQQQISALNSAGISLQPSGNGQFLAFIRPDQQRLQSLTTTQSLRDSGKARPIIVSTSSSVPIRPEAANLNLPVTNRVSTSLPAKGMSDLKKQNILPTQTFVGKVPNGNIAVKGTGNIGYSNDVKKINSGGSSVITASNNLNNGSTLAANLNPGGTEQAKPNVTTITNSAAPNNNNSVSSNIKTTPIAVTTNYSIVNNTENLKTISNTSATNSNSLVGNNSVVGTFSPPVNTNSTTNTFNACQNTYPPSSASSDINANTVPQKQTYNNSSLEALANGYGNPPVTNSYPSNAGFYNDNTNNVVNTRAQTEGIVDVPNVAASLEDFMDNMTDSNSESYSYSNPQPNTLATEGIISSDFNSSVNDIMRDNSSSNIYDTQSFPSSTNYKPAPSDGDALPGQMCRFSEEDMQTIDEILQFDGAADECTLEGKTIAFPQNQNIYRSSPRRWSVENNVSCEVNNFKTPKMESEAFYQNSKAKNFNDQNTFSLEYSALHQLNAGRALKTVCLRRDYVVRKETSCTRKLISPINTLSPDSNQNLTINDQYYLKSNIKKIDSSPENRKSLLSASMLALNGFGKFQNLTEETRYGISVRALSPASSSSVNSDNQVVPVISTINPESPKHRLISERAVGHQRGFCSFPGCFPRQLDGEDADSSSSSDDNANANANNTASDDDDDDECEEPIEEVEDVAIESEPLNSADDDSDIDICAMFESENIVVCQFEKVSRNKNKWKFHLKDGIMNLFGRDLIFSKSIGEAEW